MADRTSPNRATDGIPLRNRTLVPAGPAAGGTVDRVLYQRSREIESKLDRALQLIASGRYSTPLLAQALAVSVPTVSRYVKALRQRGYQIRPERENDGWRYAFVTSRPQAIKSSRSVRGEWLSPIEERRIA